MTVKDGKQFALKRKGKKIQSSESGVVSVPSGGKGDQGYFC